MSDTSHFHEIWHYRANILFRKVDYNSRATLNYFFCSLKPNEAQPFEERGAFRYPT